MPIKNPILRHHSGVPLVPSLPPDRARESGIAVWTRACGAGRSVARRLNERHGRKAERAAQELAAANKAKARAEAVRVEAESPATFLSGHDTQPEDGGSAEAPSPAFE